jgi:CRP-like cAMP-binding protein|tara:strand:- start:345 stop:815 length:471 start_codon:yes stop_codon:yes gene_type:complete
MIQRPGQSQANAIYVKKGVIRSYIIDSNGKEHIFIFASEGWITGDIEAVELNQPTRLYIDCLEDSELIYLGKNHANQAEMTKEQLLQNMQKLWKYNAQMQNRILMLLDSPAMDRYKYFLELYPELSNRVPQKMIASYLGIMPQTLSTIRKKIAKGK